MSANQSHPSPDSLSEQTGGADRLHDRIDQTAIGSLSVMLAIVDSDPRRNCRYASRLHETLAKAAGHASIQQVGVSLSGDDHKIQVY